MVIPRKRSCGGAVRPASALTCETEEELHRFAKGLAESGVENTGVKLDETLQKNYVAFKDPDRIQWEFYMI